MAHSSIKERIPDLSVEIGEKINLPEENESNMTDR